MRFVRPVGAAAVVESADSFDDRDNFDDTESVVDDVEDEDMLYVRETLQGEVECRRMSESSRY